MVNRDVDKALKSHILKLLSSNAIILFSLFLGLFFLPFLVLADSHVDWPLSDFTNPNKPDYGIYWFADTGDPNQDYLVMKASAKTAKGQYKLFFDPSKPTVIYFHGWQPGDTVLKIREDFFYNDPYNKKGYDNLKAWKEKGWNVGIFYWNQFADEGDLQFSMAKGVSRAQAIKLLKEMQGIKQINEKKDKKAPKGFIAFTEETLEAVERAEAKIYISNYSYKGFISGMRWAYLGADGKRHYSIKGVPANTNVTQFAFKAYMVAMKGYLGPRVRFVGHSLGAQLVMNLTGMISNFLTHGSNTNSGLMPIKNPRLMPNRVVLLDPYFSPLSRSYFKPSMTTAQHAFQTYKKIKSQHPNTLFTVYRSSPLTQLPFGDEDISFEKAIAYQRYFPGYVSLEYYLKQRSVTFEQAMGDWLAALHNSARFLYFASFRFEPPWQTTGGQALSASVSNQRVQEIEGDGYARIQKIPKMSTKAWILYLKQFLPKNYLFDLKSWDSTEAKS